MALSLSRSDPTLGTRANPVLEEVVGTRIRRNTVSAVGSGRSSSPRPRNLAMYLLHSSAPHALARVEGQVRRNLSRPPVDLWVPNTHPPWISGRFRSTARKFHNTAQHANKPCRERPRATQSAAAAHARVENRPNRQRDHRGSRVHTERTSRPLRTGRRRPKPSPSMRCGIRRARLSD